MKCCNQNPSYLDDLIRTIEGSKKESVPASGLRESLVLEALFLFGVGVCAALILLLVNLLILAWKYLVARWKNFRKKLKPKLFVRKNTLRKWRGPKLTTFHAQHCGVNTLTFSKGFFAGPGKCDTFHN